MLQIVRCFIGSGIPFSVLWGWETEWEGEESRWKKKIYIYIKTPFFSILS